jgi:hypothetical protein
VIRQEAGGTTFHVTLPLDHDAFRTMNRPKTNPSKIQRSCCLGDQDILINLLDAAFFQAKISTSPALKPMANVLKHLRGDPFDLLLVDHNKEHVQKQNGLISKSSSNHFPELKIVLFNVSKSDQAGIFENFPGIDLLFPSPFMWEVFIHASFSLMSKGKASNLT